MVIQENQRPQAPDRRGRLQLVVTVAVQVEYPPSNAARSRSAGSQMIPPAHVLRSALALKLHSIERKSHIVAQVADEGLALFAGLNAIPKRSYLSEYSCRITPRQTQRLLAAWHDRTLGPKLWDGSSFNLDFHSAPYYRNSPLVEEHYVFTVHGGALRMLTVLDKHTKEVHILRPERRLPMT